MDISWTNDQVSKDNSNSKIYEHGAINTDSKGTDVSHNVDIKMKNKSNLLLLYAFAMPIDSVEAKTGFDFFPGLTDSIENRVEGSYR